MRARVGAARVLLRKGEFGAAARRLQEAIDAGAPADARAVPLRELAVRSLLREAGAADRSRPVRTRTGVRSPLDLAPTAAGGALIGDPRLARVVELADDPSFHVKMKLEPGDMQFINNFHVMHGRTAYEDARGDGRVRHLKRLWLETAALSDRPPQFAGVLGHWDSKRSASRMKVN